MQPDETIARRKSRLYRYTVRLLVVLLSLFVIILAFEGSLDKRGQRAVDDAFKQALITFGTARALNAVISLAQGTEVGPPGVTIAVGEVLDPVNDLIERFSWIMLASTTSLGIQSIFMEIATDTAFNVLLAALIVLCNAMLFFPHRIDAKQRRVLLRLSALLLFLRFAVPLMALANAAVYTHFVERHYDIAALDRGVAAVSDELGTLKNNGYSLFSSEYYTEQIAHYKTQANDAAERIIKLIIAFVFQTIVFPLLFLFVLYRLSIALTERRH